MTRANKTILCFLMLFVSCAQVQIDYSRVGIDYSYFEYFKNAYFPEKIEIDYSVYDQINYSYLKILHQDREAVYVLATIEDDIFTWVGKELETIKTFKGIIIEMTGPYQLDSYKEDLKAFDLSNQSNLLRYSFIDPELVMHPFQFELQNIEAQDDCTLVRYSRESKIIGFKSEEEVCYKKKLPIRSFQKLNNLIGSFELEFIYKF
jgi:hypothetical protein